MPEATLETPTLNLENDTTSAEALVDDVLVEEVSIDGMCGVY